MAKKTEIRSTDRFTNLFIDAPLSSDTKLISDIMDEFIYESENIKDSFHRRVGEELIRRFSPSKIHKQGHCARKLVFEWLDAEHLEGIRKFEGQLLRNFKNGHKTHESLQDYVAQLHKHTNGEITLLGRWECKTCRKRYGWPSHDATADVIKKTIVPLPESCDCGGFELGGKRYHKFKYCEVPVNIPHLRISGAADGIIVWKGVWYLWEIKTMNAFGFSDLSAPPKYYIPQANTYALSLDLANIMWWFENKNDQSIKEFITIAEGVNVEQEFSNLIIANRHIDHETLPPKNTDPDFVKEYCGTPRKTICEFKKICDVATKFAYNMKVADFDQQP